MSNQEKWLSLDEYIDIITNCLKATQKKRFERLASKLIITLIPEYKQTSEYYPAIDGYWKPKEVNEVLRFDRRMKPTSDWVLFSMKTSSDKKRCVNLLKESINDGKNYAKKELNTESFSWIGVTNVSLSPVQLEDILNHAKSQGIENTGIFQTHEIANSFIQTCEEADRIAYELGIRLPEHIYKYQDLSPAIAAKEILRELNNIWNNSYSDKNLKCSFLSINNYFERRMSKVSFFYNYSKKSKDDFLLSMKLDLADDVFVYYLSGEELCDNVMADTTIHQEDEIGTLKNLIDNEREDIGTSIIVRDLSIVFRFYRYLFDFFFRHPLIVMRPDYEINMMGENFYSFNDIVTLKTNPKRAPFSRIFIDFCERELKRNKNLIFSEDIFRHPDFLKHSILYSFDHRQEIIKI